MDVFDFERTGVRNGVCGMSVTLPFYVVRTHDLIEVHRSWGGFPGSPFRVSHNKQSEDGVLDSLLGTYCDDDDV